jgi:hypothetical protein
LFESNSIPPGIEIAEPFLVALTHILQDKSDDLDRSEAMLLIMRFLIHPRESMTQIIRVLHDHEENLFVSFQRHIELNHSFLVLHFFMLLYGAAHFFKHWTLRIREIVLDSPFAALLVHVIQTAQNRRTVHDALSVMHIVMCGIKQTSAEPDSLLSDSLASGFCLLNRRKHQEGVTKETEGKRLHLKHLHRIRELEVERDLTANEIAQLREHSDQSGSELAANRQRADNLEKQTANLKKKLQSQRVNLREAVEVLQNSQLEMNTLSLQATQHEHEEILSTQKSEKLRTKVQSLKQVNAERQNIQRKCDQLEQKLKELGDELADLRGELEMAAERIKKERIRRKETEKLLSESSQRVNELAVQFNHERAKREESERQNRQFEGLLRKKNDEETKAAETILTLNSQISMLTTQKNESEEENLGLRQTLDKKSQRLTDLRKDRKDLAAMTQLTHRITDGKPESVQTLKTMIATSQ